MTRNDSNPSSQVCVERAPLPTAQDLQFIREQLMVATADLSGASTGQLMAWIDHAPLERNRFKRKKRRIRDELTGEWVTRDNPTMAARQSRSKDSHIPLIHPTAYATASWRRALQSLDEDQKAWLLWSYTDNLDFEHQVAITRWAWKAFNLRLGARKVTVKTMERLKALIWLAAQTVKAELKGDALPSATWLAELVGVNKTNWSQNYAPHWDCMMQIYRQLDAVSLLHVARARSQKKRQIFL